MLQTLAGGGLDKATIARLATPRLLTADRFGVHLLKHPQNTTPEPPASFACTLVRNHDWSSATHGGTRWDQLHTASSTYDWDALDAWIGWAEIERKVPVYCLMGTPAWTVAAAAVGNAAYGSKTNMVPDDLAHLTNFATQLATRYRDRLFYVEGWNEPNLATYYGGTDAYIASTATPAKMAQIQRVWFQALKAANPAIKVLSPSYTSVFSGISGLGSFLAASDGASGTGKDWFDIMAYHFYCNNDSALPHWLCIMWMQIRSLMATHAISSRQVWATEYGLITPPMAGYTDAEQRQMVRIYTTALLACGVDRMIWYSYDDDLVTGMSAAARDEWSSLMSDLIGRTLQDGEVTIEDQSIMTVRLEFADGAEMIEVFTLAV